MNRLTIAITLLLTILSYTSFVFLIVVPTLRLIDKKFKNTDFSMFLCVTFVLICCALAVWAMIELMLFLDPNI